MVWRIHEGDGKALHGLYELLSGHFTIKMYHGGDLQYISGEKCYVCGKVGYIDLCHPDEIFLIEFEIIRKKLGYLHNPTFLYTGDGFDLKISLVEIKSDTYALILHKFVNELKVLNVYMKPVTNETVEVVVEQGNINECNESSDSDSSFNVSDPDFNDGFNELRDDDELFFNNIDKDVGWAGVDVYQTSVVGKIGDQGKEKDKISDKGKGVEEGVNIDNGYETDYQGSYELQSNCSNSNYGHSRKSPKYLVFNIVTYMKSPKFKLGMLFACASDFRAVVRQYAIKNGKQITFPTNEKDKVRVMCKEGCEWVLYASMLKGEQTLQMKTFNDKHTCNRSFNISHVNCRWLQSITWSNLSNPVNGKDIWAETGLTPVLLPNYIRQLGRPKRNRSKKNDANKQNPHKLGKQGVKMSCSLCGSTDHNKRRCLKGSGSSNAINPTVPRKKLPVRGK